jgi:hypothetical protein
MTPKTMGTMPLLPALPAPRYEEFKASELTEIFRFVDVTAIIEPLIGKPYRIGAAGPDEFDCWGLVQYIQRVVFGRDVQTISDPPGDIKSLVRFVRDHPERGNWRRVEKPVHGGVVEMSHAVIPHHVGIYLDIDGGGILHCSENGGVSWESQFCLKVAGFRNFVFHERVAP